MFRKRLDEMFRLARRELLEGRSAPGEWKRLSREEISILEGNGCTASDWSAVMVSPGSVPGAVNGCRFEGEVLLDLTPFDGEEPLLRDSNLRDTEVGPGCRILSTRMLSGLVIGRGVVVENCGTVSFAGTGLCGSGEELQLGVETGERNVPSFPCLDVLTASDLSGGEGRDGRMSDYRERLTEFLNRMGSYERGRLSDGCVLRNTPVVEDSFVGPGAVISNATAVRNSTLLGDGEWSAAVTDGALVRDSILQWGALADSLAVVEASVVGEASVVERHGKLTSSFLGPNSVLAEGEITASLAGPFTAAHHQSLLIAARWPEGMGNLGYGANVGSNHTSRLPDQEIRPGEGMFFGLACSVKFPADFSRSPFSIIATGVTTLPQKVAFPFSLICEPFRDVPGIPPAFNQIIPGWVLSDNMFAVARNHRKFMERNRARRWKPREGGILREDTVSLMTEALERLEVDEHRDVYTDSHIPGLGKNFMTEEHRIRAMETYRFHTRLFALDSLDGGGGTVPGASPAAGILAREFPNASEGELLELREEMRLKLREAISSSRRKDRRRGAAVIEDYLQVRDTGELS